MQCVGSEIGFFPIIVHSLKKKKFVMKESELLGNAFI